MRYHITPTGVGTLRGDLIGHRGVTGFRNSLHHRLPAEETRSKMAFALILYFDRQGVRNLLPLVFGNHVEGQRKHAGCFRPIAVLGRIGVEIGLVEGRQ